MAFPRCDKLSPLLLATIGVWLLVPPGAWAHPGQHLGLSISISDEEVVYEVLMSNDFLHVAVPDMPDQLKLSLEDNGFRFLDPAQEKQVREGVLGLFKDASPVTIDGMPVKPLLKRLKFVPAANLWGVLDPLAPPDVQFALAYSTKGRPKRVSLVWELYPRGSPRAAPASPSPGAILAELDAYSERQLIIFTPQEPEVVWHAPGKPVSQRVQPVVVAVTPTKIRIPLLSLGVVAFWGACLLLLRVASVWRRVRRPALCFSVIPLAIAAFGHDALAISVAAPWSQSVKLPSEQEATDIFTTLQRNVYRAFDYKTESDIYDVLAQSVAGDLLDQVYNEVYQSLIMRDQGGAVARVHSVDVLDTEMVSCGRLPGSDQPAFRIRSRWQVYGVVAHWGHFHARTNEYEAIYTVAQLDDKWKITGVEVLEQQRVASNDSGPPARPPAVAREPRP